MTLSINDTKHKRHTAYMTLSINDTQLSNALPLHLIYFNAERHYPECHYTKCCYAECRGAQCNDIIYLIILS